MLLNWFIWFISVDINTSRWQDLVRNASVPLCAYCQHACNFWRTLKEVLSLVWAAFKLAAITFCDALDSTIMVFYDALSHTFKANLGICEQCFQARFVKYRVHPFPNWWEESSGRFLLTSVWPFHQTSGNPQPPQQQIFTYPWNTRMLFSSLHAEQMHFHEW